MKNLFYSYMKYLNVPSFRITVDYVCHLADDFKGNINEIVKVYEISCDE